MVFFRNRDEAGVALAEEITRKGYRLRSPIVLGIPRGGIPIGYRIAERLAAPLDVVVLRKLPIPASPEAGFGAITLDKTIALNEELLTQLFLSQSMIDKIANEVYKEVLRRDKAYRGNKKFPTLRGHSVIITDDGLASGYTALAAIRFCRSKGPKQIIIASPVAHRQAHELIKKNADRTIVLHISNQPYFAVASFYEEFPDMSDEEVVDYLKTI